MTLFDYFNAAVRTLLVQVIRLLLLLLVVIETLALEDPQFVDIYEGVQTRKRELERRANRSLWERMSESLHSKYRNVIHR